MKDEKLKKEVYFLDDNTELQVLNKEIPHQKIYIKNANGKFTISEYPIEIETNKKEANPFN